MKKTLQECKKIVAEEYRLLKIENYQLSTELLTDLANKMYYEQSECESLKAENEELKQVLSDAMELNRRQREHANKMYELIKKFKMPLITNP